VRVCWQDSLATLAAVRVGARDAVCGRAGY